MKSNLARIVKHRLPTDVSISRWHTAFFSIKAPQETLEFSVVLFNNALVGTCSKKTLLRRALHIVDKKITVLHKHVGMQLNDV